MLFRLGEGGPRSLPARCPARYENRLCIEVYGAEHLVIRDRARHRISHCRDLRRCRMHSRQAHPLSLSVLLTTRHNFRRGVGLIENGQSAVAIPVHRIPGDGSRAHGGLPA